MSNHEVIGPIVHYSLITKKKKKKNQVQFFNLRYKWFYVSLITQCLFPIVSSQLPYALFSLSWVGYPWQPIIPGIDDGFLASLSWVPLRCYFFQLRLRASWLPVGSILWCMRHILLALYWLLGCGAAGSLVLYQIPVEKGKKIELCLEFKVIN